MATIKILNRELDLAKSELLYDFTKFRPEEWTITRHTPPWQVTPEAIIGGQPDETAHGQIFYQTPVDGDVVLEFDAQLLGDSYHDFVWWWSTSLDQEPWGDGYLGCLGGWWGNYAGIEKSPTFSPSAIAPSCPIKPGEVYHIVSGGIGKIQFIAVNGQLVTYFTDATPAKKGYFGFGVYHSYVRYSKLKVYRPFSRPLPVEYLVDSEYKKLHR